ncbi:MAG: carboxypeptidase regulatory-like domain-containing protein, partial [Bacteroidales bacterium]
QLDTNFDVGDAALKNIDTIIDIVKVAQANFYNGYKNARKIVLTGTNSLTLKGFVTDATTGEPIKGVTLNFCPECAEPTQKAAAKGMSAAKEEIVLTKKTAEKGGFNIKTLPEGIYRVTIKKNGYQEQVVTVTVNDGELGDLNVELLKN